MIGLLDLGIFSSVEHSPQLLPPPNFVFYCTRRTLYYIPVYWLFPSICHAPLGLWLFLCNYSYTSEACLAFYCGAVRCPNFKMNFNLPNGE